MNNEPLTLEKLLELQKHLDAINPFKNKFIVTNDKEVYEELLKQTWIVKENVKYSEIVDSTYVMDLGMIKDFRFKPIFPVTNIP